VLAPSVASSRAVAQPLSRGLNLYESENENRGPIGAVDVLVVVAAEVKVERPEGTVRRRLTGVFGPFLARPR
jgi:hypothetical protein